MIQKQSPTTNLEISQFNIWMVGILGLFCHPLYWFFWTYLYPQPYDLWTLRFSSALFCGSFLLKNYWPDYLKKHLYVIWFFCICHTLPFIFTVHLILNQYGDIWLICEATVFLMVAILIPHFTLMTLNLLVGVACAILYCLIISPQSLVLPPHYIEYCLLFAFIYIAGFLTSYSNITGAVEMEKTRKTKLFRSIAGSIAHELRNPLDFIRSSSSNLVNHINQPKRDLKTLEKHEIINILEKERQDTIEYQRILEQTIIFADEIINMNLSDLDNKDLSKNNFTYLNSKSTIQNSLKLYGYKSQEEKSKVILDKSLEDSFMLKADFAPFTYVIFNLIKNALYYLENHPDSVIKIGSYKNKSYNIKGSQQNYNVIYIHDTGPGIAKESLEKIFDSFYTSGKRNGTGLGLNFCKRTMNAFEGDIICESQLGKWTKFSLLFPIPKKADLESALTKNKDMTITEKILLIDDQETNLKITQKKVQDAIPTIKCDLALSGEEGIKMLKNNDKYRLILLDIQMPKMDGFKTADEIRKFNKSIPIVAFTSLTYREFITQLNKNPEAKNLLGNFNYHLNKSAPYNILLRAITKWTMLKDDLSYLGSKENYTKALKNKKILLADDQEMNLMITKKKLEKYGLIIDVAKEGQELITKYKESLDKKTKESKYDMIITDINMPPFNGDEATKEIRKIEKTNHILYRNKMPIIAISGDGSKEDIYHFLEVQMTDYFIKGGNPEILTKIVANYLQNLDTCEYGPDFNRIEVTDKKESPDSTFIDFSKIADITDNDHEEMNEILSVFLKNSQTILSNIIKETDISSLYDNVHALKGVSGNIGANNLFLFSDKICEDLKNDKWPDDEKWVDKMVNLHDKTKKEVEDFLDNLSHKI